MDIVKALSSVFHKKGGSGHHDDWVDRLSWKVTGALLLCFTAIVSAKQYVGDPIECWCPAEFKDHWVKWTNIVCWVKNTYFISINNPIPNDDQLKPELIYYQWTPFILLFQAFLFFVPSLMWAAVTNHVGVSVQSVTEAGQVFSLATKVGDRDNTVKYITAQIDHFLSVRRKRHQTLVEEKLRILCSKRKGNFLVFFYLLIKVVYFLNIVAQFYLLNALLGTEFTSFGSDIINRFREGRELEESPHFPRVSLCDYKVRAMGNQLRPYTVECVLSINLFNEKIFIFLWFWLVILAIFTGLSFIRWLLIIVMPQMRSTFVLRYLAISMGKDRDRGEKTRKKEDEFVNKYLRDDGIFILRMLQSNASDLVAAEVVRALWDGFDLRVSDEEADTETYA